MTNWKVIVDHLAMGFFFICLAMLVPLKIRERLKGKKKKAIESSIQNAFQVDVDLLVRRAPSIYRAVTDARHLGDHDTLRHLVDAELYTQYVVRSKSISYDASSFLALDVDTSRPPKVSRDVMGDRVRLTLVGQRRGQQDVLNVREHCTFIRYPGADNWFLLSVDYAEIGDSKI